ncbi:MAG: MBL fold metallo-hydrolase [Pirellulales bacterium]|nr:MBL fold metallo-hydrolase [Pirellulales bacterium]
MVRDLKITVLAENTARRADLLAEHGLAFWIEADGHRILFDTGQGKVLRHNADCLQVPLETVECVAISHGHFDHTGGLKDVLDAGGQMDLYLHPAALGEKYHQEKSPPHRSIGIADLDESALRRRTRNLVCTDQPVELTDGVHLTGEIPRRNDFEDTGGPFYRDASCTEPDPLLDDQALYVETPAGLVVVLGCAHAGVVNTLDHVARLTGRRQVHAVLGGMHLVRAAMPRLDATVAAMKRYNVEKIGTAHCTGMRASVYLWSQLPEQCFECPVGSVFHWQL